MILWREYTQLREKTITQLNKEGMVETQDGRQLETCSLTELSAYLQHLRSVVVCEEKYIPLYVKLAI